MTVRCDLLLVTWNHLAYTKACIESLLTYTTGSYRLLIVDNGSEGDTIEYLDALQREHQDAVVCLKQSANLGWVRGVNEGLRHVRAPYVCLLNNDLVVLPGWLDQMIAVAECHPQIGLINPTYNRNREPLEAFRRRTAMPLADGAPYLELHECNGACLLIRREVLERLGGLDEAYGSGGMDDSDYSRRAQIQGFRCVRAEGAFVFHWENVSCNTVPDYWTTLRRANRVLFEDRWGPRRQVAMVVQGSDRAQLARRLRQALALARLGVRLHLDGVAPTAWALDRAEGRWRMGLVEHADLKWDLRSASRVAFLRWTQGAASAIKLLFKTWARRWKEPAHRLQAIVVDPGSRWVTLLRWISPAPVCRGFERCPCVAREVAWSRAMEPELWSA